MSAKKRVLVVDDEPDYCAILRRVLEKEGFEVEVAYDGVECLQKVKASPPDAIVMDVVMPEKQGHEVCRELRSDKRTSRIPIVIVTAASSRITSTRYSNCREMIPDADAYLPKPTPPEIIARNLKKLLLDH